ALRGAAAVSRRLLALLSALARQAAPAARAQHADADARVCRELRGAGRSRCRRNCRPIYGSRDTAEYAALEARGIQSQPAFGHADGADDGAARHLDVVRTDAAVLRR